MQEEFQSLLKTRQALDIASPYSEQPGGLKLWAEKFVRVKLKETNKYEPFQYLDWQWEIWKEALRVGPDGSDVYIHKLFSWPRRHGKSLCVAIYDVWRAFHFKYQKIVITANSADQASSTAFRYCQLICQESPEIREKIGAANIQAERIVFPHTRSEIIAVPNSSDAVMGVAEGINVFHKTERGNSDDNDDNFSIGASSTGDAPNGVVIEDSTVGPEGCAFNEVIKAGLSPDADDGLFVSYISYQDIEDAVANNLSPSLNERFLRRRMRDDPFGFRRFHLNQVADEATVMFTADQLEKIKAPNLLYPIPEIIVRKTIFDRFIGETAHLGGGIDRALSFKKDGDATVFGVVAKGYLKDHLRWPGGKIDETMAGLEYDDPWEYWLVECDEINAPVEDNIRAAIQFSERKFGRLTAARREQLDNLLMDMYQCDSTYTWCVSTFRPAKAVNFSEQLQLLVFTRLYQVIAGNRLKAPVNLTKLHAELKHYKFSEKKTGRNKYTFGYKKKFETEFIDHTGQKVRLKIKDDFVDMLGMAIYSLEDDAFSEAAVWQMPEVW